MNILKKLGWILEKYPMKAILFSFAAIILTAAGAQNIEMATGNDTLVSKESKVYQENEQLEKEFGGESIIVMYTADEAEDLITSESLVHMKGLENELLTESSVYSILSPVTLVEQISDKQSGQYKKGIEELISGLDEMGTKLIEIGGEVSKNGSKDNLAALSNIDGQMAELNQAMERLVNGQEKLKNGTVSLISGYSQFGKQTKEAGIKIGHLASQMAASEPQQMEQKEQLIQIGDQLIQLSEKMIETSEKSAALPRIPEQTKQGLVGMGKGIKSQKGKLEDLQKEQENQLAELGEMGEGLTEIGENLTSISEKLDTMFLYSDALKPGLPEKQETLDNMVYDDQGKLRSMFEEVVVNDRHMMMMIKFEGGVSDSSKSEMVDKINTYLEVNSLETTDVFVSGKPVLDDAIRASMKESMKKMMILSAVFMVIILFFVFKVRWRILPLGIILAAVIGTVGFMGWVSIPITMVSMAVFPILIGLGIDYAIQFQSRYSEEMNAEEDQNE